MNNEEWSRQLYEDYVRLSREDRGVRLPAAKHITFSGNKDKLTISMTADGIASNMQTNQSAFEGWCLALRFWSGVEQVVLNWSDAERLSDGHYQRFLYRVNVFSQLFPEWFSVGRGSWRDSAQFLGAGPFFLNGPGERSATKRALIEDSPLSEISESALELLLYHSPEFTRHFALTRRDRQLPVGLYRKPEGHSGASLRKVDAIFTGGKSAIDLVGIGSDAFWIFELKAKKNIAAGALAELLFYTSVVRDSIGPRSRFRFGSGKGWSKMAFLPSDIQACSFPNGRIEAVLLGPCFHPLIVDRNHDAESNLIGYLNAAIESHWNCQPREIPPVYFRATKLVGKVSDIHFLDMP